ncbi:MAG TPA: alginate lyase family protein [Vicinamibacterales bacterium]|nr:alginate lyase family protein [Vicinamibacterales bacterium]
MSRIGRYRRMARKALTRPPAQVARGIGRELRAQIARPWVRLRPALLSDRDVLDALGCAGPAALPDALARAPFFPLSGESMDAVAGRFQQSNPGAVQGIVDAADRILAHEFDLLGSGCRALGPSLPWLRDFKTGAAWPKSYAFDLDYEMLTPDSDVKVPWELSRFQHAALLGQAWLFTGRDAYRAEFVSQFDDWERENPWGYSVNWVCAMDVAIRVHNWQWAYRCLFPPASPAPPAFAARFARALYLHGEFIEQHLEQSDAHGNHYIAEAVGLVSVGAWLRHSAAGERWLQTGRRILVDEIARQVHADGVDFEQSTAYHRLVTETFLTGFLLLRMAGCDAPPAAWHRLERMFDYIAAYTKPDGRAPLIGDADDGRMQKLAPRDINDHRYLLSTAACLFGQAPLAEAAGRCWEETWWMLGAGAADTFAGLPRGGPRGSEAFPDGGIYVLRAPGAHAIVDCAEVGMNGRGGHGHNDILSFELCLAGRAVVTDCGSFVYTADPAARDRFRSTASHNGVQVDGEEINRFLVPSDLWRLSDDARPVDVCWTGKGAGGEIVAAHTGYERLSDPVRHTRGCALSEDGRMFAVRDELAASATHRYTWRFHLASGVSARVEGGAIVIDTAADVPVRLGWAGPGLPAPVLEPGYASPSYGVRVPITVIRLDVTATGALAVAWAFGLGSAEAVLERARQYREAA